MLRLLPARNLVRWRCGCSPSPSVPWLSRRRVRSVFATAVSSCGAEPRPFFAPRAALGRPGPASASPSRTRGGAGLSLPPDRGSAPIAPRARSSVDRASASEAEGHRSESCRARQTPPGSGVLAEAPNSGSAAELTRAGANSSRHLGILTLSAGGRWLCLPRRRQCHKQLPTRLFRQPVSRRRRTTCLWSHPRSECPTVSYPRHERRQWERRWPRAGTPL